jgi:hypothetical protein
VEASVAVLFSLSLFFLAATTLAQNRSTAPAPGCSTTFIKFDVKTDKSQHPVMQPESGKAIVYFVEDDTEFQSTPKPTTRTGMDGTWAGANHGNCYFYSSVDPGEHHLCANWQSGIGIGLGQKSGRPFHG